MISAKQRMNSVLVALGVLVGQTASEAQEILVPSSTIVLPTGGYEYAPPRVYAVPPPTYVIRPWNEPVYYATRPVVTARPIVVVPRVVRPVVAEPVIVEEPIVETPIVEVPVVETVPVWTPVLRPAYVVAYPPRRGRVTVRTPGRLFPTYSYKYRVRRNGTIKQRVRIR